MAAVQTVGATDPKATKKKDPEPPDGTKPIAINFLATTPSRPLRMTNSNSVSVGEKISNSGSISGLVTAIHYMPGGWYRLTIADSISGAPRYIVIGADGTEGEVCK
jgi:hypothetical protein